MLVITNRALTPAFGASGQGDEEAFGEGVNAKGPNEIRLARAYRRGRRWVVELVPEPARLTPANLPSRVEYRRLAEQCRATGRHCVFYVHGFDTSFAEALEQGRLIERLHGVEVVLFTWPSNPGGLPLEEYRNARRVAQASFGALDAALEKFGRYQREQPFDPVALGACRVSVNFLAYSLGNYLFEHYVNSNQYAAETRLFTNVVLCQADVDARQHDYWVGKLFAGQRVYVTLNENDKVLGFSEAVNYPRLGRTLTGLVAANATYVDFTRGAGVGNAHRVWAQTSNRSVRGFFKRALSGERGEETPGFLFDPRVNAFRL